MSDAAVDLGWRFFGLLLERLIAVTDALQPSERAVVSSYLGAVSSAIG
jgi:hypothetical protein